jgi:EmrB/QacA subfamily drug resistance transporter
VESKRNPWLALLVLCLGFFVILLDTTIVNVAIPTMLDSLQATLDQILWVLNAYVLTLAVLLITASRVGDILGQRNLFIAGLALFTLASAACGLSQDSSQLIVARIVQGVGAAILSPQALVIVATIFPAARRGAALGIMASVTALASVAGPTLGGLIVTYLQWRWIFLVNVPIGVAGIALAFWLVPDLRPGRQHRLDLGGVVLATAGLFAIVFGLIEGQRWDWGAIAGTALTIPEVLAAGVILTAAFVVWEVYQPEPLLPLALLRDRNYSVAVWLSALSFFGMFGFMFTTTIDLQTVLGMSAVRAGLTTLPLTLTMMVVSPLAGRFTDRIGGRYILLLGCLLFATGIGGVAVVESADAAWYTYAIPLALAGFGMACMVSPIMTVAMHDVEPVLAGAASGLLNTSRQVGGAIGAAVVGAVMQNQLLTAMHSQALTASAQLPGPYRQRFIDGFGQAAGAGLEVGRGQSGGAQVPAGLPPPAAELVQRLIHEVFVNSFVVAMRPTLAVPVAGFLLGAASCLLIVRRRTAAEAWGPAGPRTRGERTGHGRPALGIGFDARTGSNGF